VIAIAKPEWRMIKIQPNCNQPQYVQHIASFGREGQPGQVTPANDHNWPGLAAFAAVIGFPATGESAL
jgi:hypothetical protein|tara:strand:+ start:1523 stop:1726 length:204 start_codon:yes stop_codon:yes gene_type:complete